MDYEAMVASKKPHLPQRLNMSLDLKCIASTNLISMCMSPLNTSGGL